MATNYIPLRSCIHLHTFASDGNASLETICKAAARESIDCIVISDHETLGHAMNGYAGETLVITAEEITPGYYSRLEAHGVVKGASTNNHMLAMGIREVVHNGNASPQALIDEVNRQKGLSFLAHPREPGHCWENWPVSGFTGLEIWTFKAAWKRGAERAISRTYAWRNPDTVLDGPTQAELNFWDGQGKQRRVVGIGSADNHGFFTNIDGVERKLFPWEVGLPSVLSYVWVSDELFSTQPVRAFLEAIRAGRVIVAHDGLAHASGFVANLIKKPEGKIFWPGDSIPLDSALEIQVISPQPAEVRLLCDGKIIDNVYCEQQNFCIQSAGVWRIEARLEGRPWVFTNPFYVGLWSDPMA